MPAPTASSPLMKNKDRWGVSLLFEEGVHSGGLGKRMSEEEPLLCSYY